jgi:hypothetical protein
MNKEFSRSGIMVGLTIFVGLLPLMFTFSQTGVDLLLETSFKYIVWVGQAFTLLILLLAKPILNKNQVIVLAVLYVTVPFSFTFTTNGINFLILDKYVSTIMSWLVASILLSKLILPQTFLKSE